MKYIGIKFVDAVPMTAEVANEEGYRVSNNTGDGYEVTYEQGEAANMRNVYLLHKGVY